MTKLEFADKSRIVRNPRVLAGKPAIKGTRISVETVIAHLRDNLDIDDVLIAYPHLTLEDIKACLDFAAERVRTAPKAKKPSIASPA